MNSLDPRLRRWIRQVPERPATPPSDAFTSGVLARWRFAETPHEDVFPEPSLRLVTALASVVLFAGAFAWFTSESGPSPAPPIVLASRIIHGSLLP